MGYRPTTGEVAQQAIRGRNGLEFGFLKGMEQVRMIAGEMGADLDVAVENDALVRSQLDRLLAHGSFRNSRRCQAFLTYVVDEKLQGNAEHLKERTIGVSVFRQPLDYDTNANSVVRVTAGEVRRRLAQYYIEANSDDRILIDLPLGSYVPEFRLFERDESRELALPLTTEASLVSHESPSRWMMPTSVAATRMQLPPWIYMAFALIFVCGLLAGGWFVAFGRTNSSANESDRIWRGAFPGGNVLLSAGSLESAPDATAPPQEPPSPSRHLGFSFTSARTATIIGSAIGHAGGTASLLPVQDTTIENLQRTPAVLIGAFNNEWTMKLQAPLRYQFVLATGGVPNAIVDTKYAPGRRFTQEDHGRRDYGIFAHFMSPSTGQSTVIAAGLGTHGTAAVRLFLSSPELLKAFSRSAPSGWEKGNYEIVLASDLVNNLADPPKVVESYFW